MAQTLVVEPAMTKRAGWRDRPLPPGCWAMSAQLPLAVTHTSTVTPDQIDELGHMNVRWYGHRATAATHSTCETLGVAADVVATYTRHHHEQLEGNQLEVRTGILAGPRLRLYHELRNAADDDLAATFVHDIDRPAVVDTGNLSVIALPSYGESRSISLDTDRLAAAPSRAEVRERDIAIRLERKVDDEDSHGAEQVPVWLANNLIWGGERPDGESDWIRDTADGDRVAFATMESRLQFVRLPVLGTRIQSFGAVVAIGDKITHELNWVYDLDTAELLAVMEVVDLAFSIPRRQSRSIPPEMREREATRFHPDLA